MKKSTKAPLIENPYLKLVKKLSKKLSKIIFYFHFIFFTFYITIAQKKLYNNFLNIKKNNAHIVVHFEKFPPYSTSSSFTRCSSETKCSTLKCSLLSFPLVISTWCFGIWVLVLYLVSFHLSFQGWYQKSTLLI